MISPFRSADITSVPVFVDRSDHIAAFDSALSELRGLIETGVAHPQTRPGRHNVLAFCGMPGIGKTALSVHLEKRFKDGGGLAARRHRVSGRLDLSQPSLHDLQSLTLHLRAGLATEPALRWPAFDVAFSAVWCQRTREPLDEFIANDAKLNRLLGALALPEQIRSELAAALDRPELSAADAAAPSIADAVQERIETHDLFHEIPMFAPVLLDARGFDEMLAHLPVLASWDLARSPEASETDVVMFVDAFERIVDSPRLQPSSMEQAIRRMVYLLPNVLFVITTAQELTWAASHEGVEHSGPRVWPDLATADSRVLDRLSDRDADDLLKRRLLRNGEAAIPKAVRREIVRRAEGYPLYLELSVDRFDELIGKGIEVEPAAFSEAFERIVPAVLDGLEDDERDLVRAAAMLGRFNRDLLEAALPEARAADVERLLSRSFVTPDEGVPSYPFSIHSSLTASILEHDSKTWGWWSEDEWAAAAGRALRHLGGFLAGDIARPGSSDRSRLIDGFGIGVRVAQWVPQLPDWLFEAAYALRILKLPEVLELREFDRSATGAAGVLVTICRGMARRLREDFDEAAGYHRRALASSTLTDAQVLFVQHRLAKALEAFGDLDGAERNMAYVHRDGTLLPEVIEKDYVRLTLLRGHPGPALEWARRHEGSDVPTRRAQAWSLMGRVRWFSADFQGAEEFFQRILDDPELARAGLSQVTGVRNTAITVCWTRPAEGLERARTALQVNAKAGELIGEAQAHVAMAIAKVGRAPDDEVEDHLNEATELFEAADDEPELYFVLLARLFQTCVASDRAAAEDAEAALTVHLDRFRLVPYLREAASVWMHHLDPARAVVDCGAQWLDRAAAHAAWRRVLEQRSS